MTPSLKPEYTLPAACLVATGLLAASEFMDMFQFVPALGEALDGQSGGDRHSYALLILALLAGAATIVLLATGVAALAGVIALAGAVSLIVFGTLDLPDVGSVGNLDDGVTVFAQVEAEPRAGFWFELMGALGLTVAGAWLALLTPDQRMAPARALAARQGDPKLAPALKQAWAKIRRPTGSRARKASQSHSKERNSTRRGGGEIKRRGN